MRARTAAGARSAALALLASMACLPHNVEIFAPTATDDYTLPNNRIPEERIQELTIDSSDNVTLAAIIVTQTDAAAAPSILFLHGQGGNLDDYWRWMNILWERGYNVLAVDYRGYGKSTGNPTEQGLYDDAEAALATLRTWTGSSPGRIVTWGYSLGTGVASHLAVQSPTGALVLEAPFTSIVDMIERASPYAVPAEWLSDAQFDTLGRIDQITLPLAVAHGTRDRRIPFWMGEEIYAAAPQPKRLVAVAGAGHGNVLPTGEVEIFAALSQLDESLVPAP